jgi:ABC-type lipoprotein release transport system permease subunit
VTALSRLQSQTRVSTVEVDVGGASPAQLATLEHQPGVAAVARLIVYAQQVDGYPDLQIAAATDDRLGTVVDRALVVSGRAANPREPYEIAIGEGLAKLAHLRVGDRLPAQSMTPDQMDLVKSDRNPGPPRGPSSTFTVVGIVRRPLDLGDRAATGGVVVLTPAFNRLATGRMGVYADVLRVRTDSSGDVPRVLAAAERVFGPSLFSATDLAGENDGATDAINVLSLALWIFAGVTALAGAVTIAILLTREIAQTGASPAALQSLGMTRAARTAVGVFIAIAIAVLGVSMAVVLALALAPLFPIGTARLADPSVGFHIDFAVIGVGVLVLAAFVLAVGAGAARRAGRVSGTAGRVRSHRRRATTLERSARAGLPPAFTNGVRMALEPGRGERAVPVRSAYVGGIFGVLGVTALVVFVASLTHLATTPHLYGWTFDFTATDIAFAHDCGANTNGGVDQVRGVGDVAVLCAGPIHVDDRSVTGWGLTPVRGRIDPEIVVGRAPNGPNEVALGAKTLSALHAKIGDTVRARAAHATGSYRVVGQAAFPRVAGDVLQPLDEGAFFTNRGFAPLVPDNDVSRYVVARFAPKADRASVLATVGKLADFNPDPSVKTFEYSRGARPPSAPPEIDRLQRLGWLAPVLGVLLALLAVLAVGHALVTSVRRRKRELAVLKTFGFTGGQVRATIGWQATTLATVSVVVGVPIGIVIGRFAWRLLANTLGVSTSTWIPLLPPFGVVVAAIVIVNLIGMVPARAAARTRPAVALRAE